MLRLILVLRPPHRGLLAAACPSQALHWLGGAKLGRELSPSSEDHGAPVIILQFCICGNPEKGGNTLKCCHPPHSEQAHHGHLPPTLAVAPNAKATTNPDRSRKKRMRRCSRHLGHGQHPQTVSPIPSHVQQWHLKPRSLRWHTGGPQQGSSTQGSSCPAPREAQLPQPLPRHRQPQKGNNVHRNSTYSGSLLHNNRHLTQGSPDFTDSKKGEKGREDSAGKGSQRDGEDRARPALVTGVQNGPELQLQVRLNILRADTISLLPTSCLVWLDHLHPPSSPSLPKSPQGPPWVWGGQGSSISWHQAVAALSCWHRG